MHTSMHVGRNLEGFGQVRAASDPTGKTRVSANGTELRPGTNRTRTRPQER